MHGCILYSAPPSELLVPMSGSNMLVCLCLFSQTTEFKQASVIIIGNDWCIAGEKVDIFSCIHEDRGRIQET